MSLDFPILKGHIAVSASIRYDCKIIISQIASLNTS